MTLHVEFTFSLWWVVAWLAVGVLLTPLVEWLGWRSIAPPRKPFRQAYWQALRRRPYWPLVVVALWPLALWGALR